VNAPEADGTTALHWAAHWGDLAVVDALLQEGANATALNRYGATPLSEAVRIGGAPLIEKLLKAGADANAALFLHFIQEWQCKIEARTARDGTTKSSSTDFVSKP